VRRLDPFHTLTRELSIGMKAHVWKKISCIQDS